MEKHDFELSVDNARVRFHFGPNFLNHRYVWDSPRHSNVSYELHVILRGTCTAEVAEDTLSLSAGDALIVAPGTYHAARAGDGPFERFTVTFSAPRSALAADLQKIIPSYVQMGAPTEIRGLCSAIMREYGDGALHRDELLRFQLGQLFVFLLRQFALLGKRAAHSGRGAGNMPREMAVMATTIEAFFVRNMANYGIMQQLADKLHISKRQLCRLIPSLYGMTFREKLLDTRMDYAAYLLRTTQKSTAEICKLVGYSSEPTFYTNFKQHYGLSPARYRRRYRLSEGAAPEPTKP